tara:strand:- start:2761 stop:3498 length:738 start_codon:yes stop_codon:yes gene_type:complete
MVSEDLIKYIGEGLKKGYSKEELEKILQDSHWSNLEISEAFTKLNDNPIEQKDKVDDKLKIFIDISLKKGIDRKKIKQVLINKGWPSEKIDSILPSKEVIKTTTIKKNILKKDPFEKKDNSILKKVLLYSISFIVISLILSLSVGILFYIQGIENYKVTHPDSGNEVRGYCLEEDCSDMKDFIFDSLKDKLVLILSIALSISLVLILLHAFIPNKETIIWIANILFFLFIIYILYAWFSASTKTF